MDSSILLTILTLQKDLQSIIEINFDQDTVTNLPLHVSIPNDL